MAIGRNLRIEHGAPGVLALVALVACTYLSFHFHQSFAFSGFLFLVLVVIAALYGGFWQATIISIAAAASLNYFFVPPIFSFVNSTEDWVALGAFEFTALVISRLSLRALTEATDAIAGRRDMERLYETSRRILLLNSSGDIGKQITSLVREIYDLEGVQLFDSVSVTTHQLGAVPSDGESRTRDAYFTGQDWFDPQTATWYCALRWGRQPVGGLALHGSSLSRLAASALASLCGMALERIRALEKESHSEAARKAEQLHTAVLDALAHDFKTPLAIARTASSGLLVIGGLSELQADLVTSIDQQVAKLDHLASRLLTAARLEAAEFKPLREPVLFSTVVHRAIQKVAQESDRRRFRVAIPNTEVPVSADPELILASISQITGNAIQYSEPGSPIDVSVSVAEGAVVIRILTKGLVVAPHERVRIFERFYRAPKTRHLPEGTGLGLSIVKKIIDAHSGSVWAEGVNGYGTAFSISLPVVPAGLPSKVSV